MPGKVLVRRLLVWPYCRNPNGLGSVLADVVSTSVCTWLRKIALQLQHLQLTSTPLMSNVFRRFIQSLYCLHVESRARLDYPSQRTRRAPPRDRHCRSWGRSQNFEKLKKMHLKDECVCANILLCRQHAQVRATRTQTPSYRQAKGIRPTANRRLQRRQRLGHSANR